MAIIMVGEKNGRMHEMTAIWLGMDGWINGLMKEENKRIKDGWNSK